MLLLPLIGEARYAKCVAIPVGVRHIARLSQYIAHAKGMSRYDSTLHSVQFYDGNVYWLASWPEGFPLDEEWRLDHTVEGEKPWNEEVVGFIERCLWQPKMLKDSRYPHVVFHTWNADQVRVVVTEGGVHWVALGPCPAYGQCREQQVMEMEVATHCIAEEYLNYIPHAAGEIDQYSR